MPLADRQRVEHGVDLLRPHHDEAVGLAQVGGDLGDELVGCHAHGGSEPGTLADQALDLARDVFAVTQRARPRRDVKERLVERQALHQRRELAEDRKHLPGHVRVVADARPDADGVGAAPQRLAHGHGRVDAVAAHLVARRRHHAPSARAAHDDGPAAQRWVVALLDRRVEGVHVHVQDGAVVHGPKDTRAAAPRARVNPASSRRRAAKRRQ